MGSVCQDGTEDVDPTGRLELRSAGGKNPPLGLCITPEPDKKLRIAFLSYQPSNPVECYFTFLESERVILYHKPYAGGIVAKDFGDGRYLQGGINQSLQLVTVGDPGDIYWNAMYTEVD